MAIHQLHTLFCINMYPLASFPDPMQKKSNHFFVWGLGTRLVFHLVNTWCQPIIDCDNKHWYIMQSYRVKLMHSPYTYCFQPLTLILDVPPCSITTLELITMYTCQLQFRALCRCLQLTINCFKLIDLFSTEDQQQLIDSLLYQGWFYNFKNSQLAKTSYHCLFKV